MTFFKEFNWLISSILLGLRAMMWCVLVMMFLLYLAASCLTSGALDQCGGFRNSDTDVCQYFGSLSVSALSLLKAVSGGTSWGLLYTAAEELGTIYIAAFLFFVLFWMVVVTNVMTA